MARVQAVPVRGSAVRWTVGRASVNGDMRCIRSAATPHGLEDLRSQVLHATSACVCVCVCLSVCLSACPCAWRHHADCQVREL